MTPRRGLLDFVLTVVACAAVYGQTPVGGLIDRGLAWTLGTDRPQKPLTSFFDFARGDSDGPTAEELERLAEVRVQPAGALGRLAQRRGVSIALARAIDLAAGESTARTVDITERVEAMSARLGHLDAALEAFVLGEDEVTRAIDRARRDGRAEPETQRGHERYLTRIQRERAAPYVNQVMAIYTALTFEWPVGTPHRISSPFGYRGDPFLGTRRFHNGVDLAIRVGTEIRSAGEGRVKYATYDGVNGYFVKMTHGYGLSTAYCHNSELLVRPGDRALQGQVIALSGNTGRSTGPHLHYIVRIGRKAIDPEQFGSPRFRDMRRRLK